MKTGFRVDWKTLLKLLAVTVILWAVWFPVVTSGNIRMDSDQMIHTPEISVNQYIREGRSALVWLLQLFGLTVWNPLRSGILFLCFFSLACWVLYFTLRRLAGWQGLYPELFILLYGLSPIWAYHGYFVLQIAAVGFGILLTVTTACVDTAFFPRRDFGVTRLIWEIAALALLSFALLIYQSLIVCWLAVLLTGIFCWLSKGGKISLRMLVPLFARLFLSLAVYYLVSRRLGGSMDSGNMSVQVRWGADPLGHCLIRIAEEVGAVILMYTSRYFSLYTLGAVLIILLWFRKRKTEWAHRPGIVIAGICMLLLPFALTVLLGNVTVPRSQFALQLVAAFFPVFYLAETKGKHRVLCTVCVLALVLQTGLSLRLYHTDQVRNEQDTAAAEAILTELEDKDTSKPLAFVGVRRMDTGSLLTEKSDVYGRTFFEWIYDESDPSSASIPALRLLTACGGKQYTAVTSADQKQAATEAAKNMPSCPDAGFVREEEDMIVIKLSD